MSFIEVEEGRKIKGKKEIDNRAISARYIHVRTKLKDQTEGMDLRDWYASNAPPIPDWFQRIGTEKVTNDGTGVRWCSDAESWMDFLVRWRFAYADAMMKGRNK